MQRRHAIVGLLGLTIGMATVTVATAGTPETADPKHTSASGQPLAFYTESTVAWLGGTRVIPFRFERPAEADRRFEATSSDPDVLEVIREPEVLEGHAVGYLRVRARRAGEASLSVGGAELQVTVRPSPSRLAAARYAPTIATPASGAVVWGTVGVGVDLFDDPVQVPGAPRRVELRVIGPDGSSHDGAISTAATDDETGPVKRAAFDLDTAALPGPGVYRLVPGAVGEGGERVEGEPIRIAVARPSSADLIEAEAEVVAEPCIPTRYQQRPLNLTESAEASGGVFVNNAGTQPVLSIPLVVAADGWYQLILRVAGDGGGGMLPVVGLRVDDANRPRTAGELARPGWHRVPVGTPVRLKAGERWLVPYFENDFYGGKGSDRNLRIDRYDLLRLDRPPTDALPLHASLSPELHGAVIGGDVTVRGAVWGPGIGPKRPPAVTLHVNGEPVATQYAAAPTFELSRGVFKPGENDVRLTARAGTREATSAVATVKMLPHPAHPTEARAARRWVVADPAWGLDAGALAEDRRAGGQAVRSFASHGSIEIELPRDLVGPYRLALDARGDRYEGWPIAELTLLPGPRTDSRAASAAKFWRTTDAKPLWQEQVEVRAGNYAARDVGTVDLPRGVKRLRVAFINDAYGGAANKDRNLYIRAVELREPAGGEDTAPPVARLAERHDSDAPILAYDIDAVIAEVADDREVRWVQAVIDGHPYGPRFDIDAAGGRVLVPMMLDGVEPGERAVSVRVADHRGQIGTSEPVRFDVLGEEPIGLTNYERAVRLLQRFGYGPETDELAAVLIEGERAYLADRLARPAAAPGDAAAWAVATAESPNDSNVYQVARRTLRHATTTPNPARTRFVLLMDNHFTTWIRKARAERKVAEYETLQRLGAAPFEDLLFASATSPAMMVYLDQSRSFGKRLNENYAREIMELHTVGVHAGYAQQDVTELASLLTGWRSARRPRDDGGGGYLADSFRFAPKLNDPRPRTVFGMRFAEQRDEALRYDRARLAVEMLASHPETARFICTKIAEHYLGVPADRDTVGRLSDVFMSTGGDTRAVLLAIADEPALWERGLPRRLAHPIDYGVAMHRLTGDANGGRVYGFLQRSGFGVFDRETPDGYPEEDQAYADTNALLQRWKLAREMSYLLARLLPPTLRDPPSPPAVGDDADDAARAKAQEAYEAAVQRWREQVVDTIAVRLTGDRLSERSRQAAIGVLTASEAEGYDRIRMVATLIAQLPEANMR